MVLIITANAQAMVSRNPFVNQVFVVAKLDETNADLALVAIPS